MPNTYARYFAVGAPMVAIVAMMVGSSPLAGQSTRDPMNTVAVRAVSSSPPQTMLTVSMTDLLTAVRQTNQPTSRPDLSWGAEQFALVDVRTLMSGHEEGVLREALRRHSRDITAMREALQAHMTLRDVLVARDVPMSQVIAVDASNDTKRAVVYYLQP